MDDQQEAEALHQQKDERTPQQELPGQVNAGVLHQAQLAEANGKESADERKSKPRVCHFKTLLEAWGSADKARHKANVQLDIAGETTDNIYHMRALQSRRQTKIGTQRRRTNICDDAAPTGATMLGEISPERAQHEAPTRGQPCLRGTERCTHQNTKAHKIKTTPECARSGPKPTGIY